ncbi:DUF2892 domain-containing protein [Candidatus Saccharibacteria bacterium]|nr:DUF2892 domain-containing protein [Candidatus Saccharibacteria bacterium]
MPSIPNPDEIYHKASEGRLKNTSNPNESYDEVHFISVNVEGSEEYEREKQRWRETKSVQLDDRIIPIIVALIVLTSGFAIAFAIYGWRLPYIAYFVLAATAALACVITYFVVRKIKLARESREYKKHQKNPPQKP